MLEGRNFIGIEKNEHSKLFKSKDIDYIKESIKRIQNAYINLTENQKKTILCKNILERSKI